MPSTLGIEPFGTSVADVAALVPSAAIPETRGAGQKAVIEADVEEWITRLSAEAAVTLDRWDTLTAARQAAVKTTARNLVAVGAASYLEAARNPERAGVANASYADILWTRWTTGLAALAARVTEWANTDPATSLAQPAASFPDPVIPDTARW